MELQPTQFYNYYVRDLCMSTLRDAGVDMPRMTSFFALPDDVDVKTSTLAIKRIIADQPFQVLLETATPDPRGTILQTFLCGGSVPLGKQYYIYNRDMTPVRAYLRVADCESLRIEHITMLVSISYMDGTVQKNLSQHIYYRKNFGDRVDRKTESKNT